MISDIIKGRRSISFFAAKTIPLNVIDELIAVSGYAPSSCNTQPWYFLVFHTDEAKEKLNAYIARGYEHTSRSLKDEHRLMGGIYTKLLDFFSHYGKFDAAPVLILLFAKPYDTPLFSQAISFAKTNR
jgi:nitroreductase